uniref:DUF4145 domain-containing protein n=1 Tax=Parastrongyloides trichosuri TaxID=131310 RepID=A0A0N4ZSG2_PARTI
MFIFRSFWRNTKGLIVSNNRSLENIDEILKCLRTLKCRDPARGRLALDARYELFLASYALMTTDHNTVYGKEILIRILGTTINRAINHFQDMMSALEDKPNVTIRETMQYFKVDKEIADFRNDFAHGNIPNIFIMTEAIDELTNLIIELYWKKFDGEIFTEEKNYFMELWIT